MPGGNPVAGGRVVAQSDVHLEDRRRRLVEVRLGRVVVPVLADQRAGGVEEAHVDPDPPALDMPRRQLVARLVGHPHDELGAVLHEVERRRAPEHRHRPRPRGQDERRIDGRTAGLVLEDEIEHRRRSAGELVAGEVGALAAEEAAARRRLRHVAVLAAARPPARRCRRSARRGRRRSPRTRRASTRCRCARAGTASTDSRPASAGRGGCSGRCRSAASRPRRCRRRGRCRTCRPTCGTASRSSRGSRRCRSRGRAARPLRIEHEHRVGVARRHRGQRAEHRGVFGRALPRHVDGIDLTVAEVAGHAVAVDLVETRSRSDRWHAR